MSTITIPLSVVRDLPASALGRLFAARIVDMINEQEEGLLGDWVADLDDETIGKIMSTESPKAQPKPKEPTTPRAVRASSPDPKQQEALLEVLGRVRSQGASAETIRAELGVSPGQVKGLLKRAKDSGLVRVEGERRNTRYFLVEKAA